MKILSLDTSGPVAGCALTVDGRVRHSIAALHGKTHSESIMPMVDEVLSASGVTARELDCIAVVAGPGSFTGVRIGVCAAKGLAHAWNIPCARIDALEALAVNCWGFDGIAAPILDARRQQVYSAAFDVASGFPVRRLDDDALPITQFLEKLPTDRRVVFLGDGLDSFREVIQGAMGDRALFAPAHLRDLRPETAGILAEARPETWVQGALLTPIYLRVPQAVRERSARLAQEGRA